MAVTGEAQGAGVGRRLLEHAESILQACGAVSATLGSLDGAVDFYLHNGYSAQLLVQFAPEAVDPEAIITFLLTDVLAGRAIHRAGWNGHPQLWLQSTTVDWDLKHSIEGAAEGVVAQYVMSKRLTDDRS